MNRSEGYRTPWQSRKEVKISSWAFGPEKRIDGRTDVDKFAGRRGRRCTCLHQLTPIRAKEYGGAPRTWSTFYFSDSQARFSLGGHTLIQSFQSNDAPEPRG